MKNAQLWRALGRNILISLVLFAALLGLLWLAELLFPSLSLLHWDDAAWVVGIPASIIGVAYILTIRDPQNYTGFYAGIVMSLLLGVQFILQGGYDSAVLFFLVFVAFQIKSIINWSKPAPADDAPFAPEFMSLRALLLSLLALVVVTLADYVLVTYLFSHDSLTDAIAAKLCNGLLISSSVLANFWLIYRKTDAWFYWVLYSAAGIVLFVMLGNIFSIVLFLFFLVINAMAGISWIKMTPRDNYGWLKGR